MSAEKQLLERVNRLIAAYDMLPDGATVLCAVSGGLDSMVLLHLLQKLTHVHHFRLRACHFDHMMRANSAADAQFVRAQCAERGIAFDETRQDVKAWARAQDCSGEEAGRILRYRWLEQLADNHTDCVIATAHHADDNAETVLLHWLRGAGLNGLGGISPRRGNIIRPLLDVPRSLIAAYAQEEGVPHVEDETNADPDYTPRNLLRAQVMPLLRSINPNLTDTVSATSATLRQDAAYLEQAACVAGAQCSDGCVSISTLKALHPAVAARVLQRAALQMDAQLILTARQRQSLLALCADPSPSGEIALPHGICARKSYDSLCFLRRQQQQALPCVPLDFIGGRVIGHWSLTVERASCPTGWRSAPTEFYLPADSPVLLRARMSGDALRLPNRAGTKTLKKWFIEEKIPLYLRDRIPVLEQNGQPAAVYLLGTAQASMPEAGQECLHITITEENDGYHEHA